MAGLDLRPKLRLAPQMERIVRPFVTIESAPATPPTPRKPLPGEDGEAFISWGASSRFIRPNLSEPLRSDTSLGEGGFKITWPKDEEEEEKTVRQYSEISRETETIRVENPDDEEQYVMVERINTIDFSSPDGSTVRFILKNT
jgi:hypothetical protein